MQSWERAAFVPNSVFFYNNSGSYRNHFAHLEKNRYKKSPVTIKVTGDSKSYVNLSFAAISYYPVLDK